MSWEVDWLHEILQDVDIHLNEIIDTDYNLFLDRLIFICSTNSWPGVEKTLRYFQECDAKGLTYGMIHLSDEIYLGDLDTHPNLRFSIRNYWHKRFANNPNVLCIPLGYKQKFWEGFTEAIKDSKSRKYSWSFAGQMKSSRIEMISELEKIPHGFFYETFSFGSGLSTQEYRDLLLESVFAPCPRGWWNLDSFRVSEALEAGCIPIVEKTPLDYFQHFYGPYPFLAVSSWSEARQMMAALQQDPARLEKLRQECYDWWKSYKIKVRQQVAQIIKSRFSPEPPVPPPKPRPTLPPEAQEKWQYLYPK